MMRDEMKVRARSSVARRAPWLLWPNPESASSLQIERKFMYLQTLDDIRGVEGAVLEVGCYLCGTAVMASSFLARTGSPRRYVCIDTFSGFNEEHFALDVKHGTPPEYATLYDTHTAAMVRRLVAHWDREGSIEIVEGDICTMPDAALPPQIAACLLDVDLEFPIYEGLARIAPRMAAGGVILVDDCPETTTWMGARKGYARYCHDAGIPEGYVDGFGVIAVPR